jgi:hypothetical protein
LKTPQQNPPESKNKRILVCMGITLLISILLTLWGIYVIQDYGLALFILIPMLLGALPTVLYGKGRNLTHGEAVGIGLLTMLIYSLMLLLYSIEGIICIVMALPIGLIFNLIGSTIGHLIIYKKPGKAPGAMLILIGLVPTTGWLEKDIPPNLTSVVSSMEIEADPSTVWKHVVEFPQLEEPSEFIFQTGIAYPINANIEGTGVGAIRHCNFTTGSFVEPITVWDEPRLLRFDVLEQPAPMKELSFWDIDAPHLHDYFVSKQGQFKLTQLPNGNTLLEGTTWYYHNIRPAIYWRLWSDYIIHKIHERVLIHIKRNAERSSHQ